MSTALDASMPTASRRARGPVMFEHRLEGKKAWTAADIRDADWIFELPAPVLSELRTMVDQMRQDPLPMLMQSPQLYTLPETTRLMRRIKGVLDDGVGFALLDRLPIEEMTHDEAKMVYWVMGSLVARPVAQKWNGTMLMDVQDSGYKPLPGSGVRLSQTNVDLFPHNDNAHNDMPAEYVGLLTLRISKSGGLSRVASFYSVHNWLRENRPDVLPRLYRAMFFDRMKEHRAEDSPLFNAPIFKVVDGELKARLGTHQIRNAYLTIEGGMDAETKAAIDAVEEAFMQPLMNIEMQLQPGQVQFVNNSMIGHARTEFVDYEETDRRRLLVRLWLRDGGTPNYRGSI